MIEAPPGGEEHALVAGRAALAWRRRGPSTPSIVLCHGAGGNHRSFDELVAALDREDVIVPALPGRAGSEGAAPASAFEAAAFVRALLAALGVARFVVMGHSYGGAVAIELCLADAASPSPSIDAAVLVSTGARLRVHPAILERARAAASGDGPPLDLRVAYQADTDPELVARSLARVASVPPASALADWIAANAFDRMTELGSIRVPLVALAGEDDALTPPRYAEFLAARVPGARAGIAAGAGHMLPVERPELVVAALRNREG